MSMGGAFGALGGDLSVLSYNPGGIGVYRRSDIGVTMDVDVTHTDMNFFGQRQKVNTTRFLLDNAGYIGTVRLPGILKNFNWGFTYNRVANFNRRYLGTANGISNSMSNYIAGVANDNNVWISDVKGPDRYNNYSDVQAPWITILGYDTNIISPASNNNESPQWKGLYGNGTSGLSKIAVEEKGGIDEYNIAFGGNFLNMIYWGMDFGILNVDYTRSSLYTEYLDNAYVGVTNDRDETHFVRSQADWDINNYYHVSGTGWNYKLGLIFKPFQELRLGFAFHTPTWYQLTEDYAADTSYNYPDTSIRNGYAETNDGFLATNDFNLRTPWRFMASAACVAAGRMIVSLDVDWTSHQYLHLSDPYYDGGSWTDAGGDINDPFYYPNKDIKDYYKTSMTIRAGVEFRVTDSFSLRAGYAHTDSPVRPEAKDNEMTIYTSGTDPSYEFDNATDYISGGLGFRHKAFYADLAYVYKHRTSDWHAFTCDPLDMEASGAQGELTTDNHQAVLTLGFKF